jgi:hypothetical protein
MAGPDKRSDVPVRPDQGSLPIVEIIDGADIVPITVESIIAP